MLEIMMTDSLIDAGVYCLSIREKTRESAKKITKATPESEASISRPKIELSEGVRALLLKYESPEVSEETLDKKSLMLHEIACSKLYQYPELLVRATQTYRRWMLKDEIIDCYASKIWSKLLIDNVSTEYKSLSDRILDITKYTTLRNTEGRRIRNASPLIHGLTAEEKLAFLKGWTTQLKLSVGHA